MSGVRIPPPRPDSAGSGMPSRHKAPSRGVKEAGPSPEARPQLFQAKLRPPLDTARILQRADLPGPRALGEARLVLLHAPAGFGKTTALCRYERALREHGTPTGWLTLDADDNDVARFVAYLQSALGRCVPAAARLPHAGASQGDIGAALGRAFELIDSVASSREPFALFL